MMEITILILSYYFCEGNIRVPFGLMFDGLIIHEHRGTEGKIITYITQLIRSLRNQLPTRTISHYLADEVVSKTNCFGLSYVSYGLLIYFIVFFLLLFLLFIFLLPLQHLLLASIRFRPILSYFIL